MLRNVGARLAVPLILVFVLAIVATRAAAAPIDGCRPTPTGIECGYRGTTTSTTVVPRPSLPPLRYLATVAGECWYWSRYPPGFDSWDSANDQSIIFTRFRLRECQGRTAPAPIVITSERAWEIFRAFPLPAPVFSLSPAVGITNLPSRLHLRWAPRLIHSERLADGRLLEVEAWVSVVWIEWGDGTPIHGTAPQNAMGFPGHTQHTYARKTCPPDYRRTHLDGPKCHPTLERYPVTITFQWSGRYRTGGAWLDIGSIDRSTGAAYDVDEILGVLVAP